jgi:hypothetical protein
MHLSLRKEVQDLLSYLGDELDFDRPGPPLRQATVEGRRSTLERLVGFAENVQGCPRVEALADVLAKETVSQYIKWAKNERRVLGETIVTDLSGIYAIFQKHPKYTDLDLSMAASHAS